MIRLSYTLVFFSILLTLALQSCVNDASVPPLKELKLGDSIISNSFIVPIGGGRFYSNSVDTTNCVRIIFLPNSYQGSRDVTFSTTNITGSSFGASIEPISPLYTIDVGNDFSSKDIIIDIPLAIDTNYFTMAFFYDALSHQLEGIPTIGYLVRAKPKQLSITIRRSGSFFVSTIAKTKLPLSIASQFDPKLDNWEFPNYPTILTPNGQFVGQTMSALWYYYEKTLHGSPHLSGNYDGDHGGMAPKVWQDNNFGFQVASQTDRKINWGSTAFDMMTPLDNGNAVLTLNQALYSIMVTGQPQLITVLKDSTVLPLIVYSVADGKMFVADPNFPTGVNQPISSRPDGNTYRTGTSINELNRSGGSVYKNATYIGVRAMVDWDKLAGPWSTNVSPDSSFPSNSVELSDLSGPLKTSGDHFVTLSNTISLNLATKFPGLTRVFQDGLSSEIGTSQALSVHQGLNRIGLWFRSQSSDGADTLWTGFQWFNVEMQPFLILPESDTCDLIHKVTLRAYLPNKRAGKTYLYQWTMGDGTATISQTNIDSISYLYNALGMYVVALNVLEDGKSIGTVTSAVTIKEPAINISPMILVGALNYAPIFHATINNKPKAILLKYVWDFGDGSPQAQFVDIDSIKHVFSKAGTFQVRLQVFDYMRNIRLGEVSENCLIKPLLVSPSILSGMRYVNVNFVGANSYSGDGFRPSVLYWNFLGGASSDTVSTRLKWNSLNYTAVNDQSGDQEVRIDSLYYSSSDRFQSRNELSGTLSSDAQSVQLFSCYDSYNSTHDKSSSGPPEHSEVSHLITLNGANIPVSEVNGDTVIYTLSGPQLQSLLSNIAMREAYYYMNGGSGIAAYESTNWSDTTEPPKLTIKFFK